MDWDFSAYSLMSGKTPSLLWFQQEPGVLYQHRKRKKIICRLNHHHSLNNFEKERKACLITLLFLIIRPSPANSNRTSKVLLIEICPRNQSLMINCTNQDSFSAARLGKWTPESERHVDLKETGSPVVRGGRKSLVLVQTAENKYWTLHTKHSGRER